MKNLQTVLILFIFLSMVFFSVVSAQTCNTGADADCDGNVSLTELMDYIDLWYGCSSCYSDLFQAIEAYYNISFCGDLSCDADENCISCPGDCGVCDPCAGITECANYTIANCTSPDPCSVSTTGCEWNDTTSVCEPAVIITYYVSINDTNCNDSGNGTSAVPWCNLNRSYTWYSGVGPKVQEGDTVIFRNGNYGEFRESTGGEAGGGRESHLFYRSNWITYQADSGHTPTLNNIYIQNQDKWSGAGNGDSYLVFDGFNITDGISLQKTSYVKILNSDVQRIPHPELSAGYYAPYFYPYYDAIGSNAAHYITIQGNDISNAYGGIGLVGTNWLVQDNEIHNIVEDGISMSNTANITIDDNYLWGIRWHATTVDIIGTINGVFIPGEVVTMPGTDATGIVHDEQATHLRVYQMTGPLARTFWTYWWADKNRIILGEDSGATVDPVMDVDPPHVDLISLDVSVAITGLVIQNNVLDRQRSAGPGALDGQAVKLWARGGPGISGTLENNLITAAVPCLFAGLNNFNINNNTIIGGGGCKLRADQEITETTINNMYNNLIERLVISDPAGGASVEIQNHGNNIFGMDPTGLGADYPFVLNNSEVINTVPIFDGNYNPVYGLNNDMVDIGGNPVHVCTMSTSGSYVGALECVNECTAPESQPCPLQQGVCSGSNETCSGIYWPGCDSITYSNWASSQGWTYQELTETLCGDFKDNDCDGQVDNDDFDCSFTGPSGLFAYYQFEGNVFDALGNNHGTAIGNPSYVSREGGQAIQFNGTNYVNVGTMGDFGSQIPDNYSVSFWIKTDSTSKSAVYGVEYDDATPVLFYINYGFDRAETPGYVYAQAINSEGGTRYLADSPNINDNEWHHIVVVHSPAVPELKIYNNNVLLTTSPRSGTYTSGSDFVRSLFIGAQHDRSNNPELFLNGSIDEVMIYNRALNETEIQEIYDVQK